MFLPPRFIFVVGLITGHLASAAPATYTDIVACLSGFDVPQDIPGTPSFAQDSLPWNLRLNYTPVAIAVPSTVPQVQAAVSCGASLGVKVNPKSGGHSYASHSLGGDDGHLVIDLKLFNNVSLDTKTNIATVGPGARLGNVALGLYDQGGRGFAHGICPGVGLGGHILHGGQGYSSHSHGLALDFMVEATVVLANSSIAKASLTHNTDLFWALRGAGMSYGVVTEFKLSTFAAPPENILFYYPYLWNKTEARAGWDGFQKYCGGFTCPVIPTAMNIRVVIVKYADDDLLFLFEGAFHGSQADFEAAIAPFLAELENIGGFESNLAGNYSLGWLDSLLYANSNGLFSNWNNGQVLETPLNYSAHATIFAKSLMTNNLSPAAVDAWIDRLYATGPSNDRPWYFIIAAQGGPTSVVPLIPDDATSYAHRSQIYEWQLVDAVSSGLYPNDIGIPWLNAFIDDIQAAESQVTLGMYYNYADPTLSPEEAHERYWLDHYARLSVIKAAVDPDEVFENPQSVNS